MLVDKMTRIITQVFFVANFSVLFSAIILYRALVFSLIWNMLMPQLFGAPALSVAASVILWIIFTYNSPDFKDQYTAQDLKKLLFSPVVSLLIAYVAKYFI